MRFSKVVMVMLSALVVLAVASAPASAQRFADSSGTTLAVGTPVVAGSSTLFMTTSMGTTSCALRVQGAVASSAALDPVSASVSSCTDTMPLFSVCSATATAGPLAATAVTPTGGHVGLSSMVVALTYCGGLGTCTYGSAFTFTANNAANTLALSQSVPRVAGGGICPASMTWSTTLTPVWADVDNDGVKDVGESAVRVLP